MKQIELTDGAWEQMVYNKGIYTAIVHTAGNGTDETSRVIKEVAEGYLNLVGALEKGVLHENVSEVISAFEEDLILAESDEFKAIQDDDGLVRIMDGENVIRITMDYDIWEKFTSDAIQRRML